MNNLMTLLTPTTAETIFLTLYSVSLVYGIYICWKFRNVVAHKDILKAQLKMMTNVRYVLYSAIMYLIFAVLGWWLTIALSIIMTVFYVAVVYMMPTRIETCSTN